ncbi:2'-5' RNA ligase family protein [Candidatus Saccharibacteria bacterium]|nr:2'-5' RNA ligase family protein [Candidatus Saccharibacteria bacterium]
MDRFTQKYTVVHFFDNIEEGYEYSSDNWPLHSTVVGTFALKWSIDEMVTKLTDVLKYHATANSEAGDDRFFGKNGQVQVVLLGRTESLIKLHLDVLATLEDGELALNDPQFARDGFIPHATVQKHARLNKGDKVLFTALSIIDMFPNEDPYMRRVLKTIKIG